MPNLAMAAMAATTHIHIVYQSMIWMMRITLASFGVVRSALHSFITSVLLACGFEGEPPRLWLAFPQVQWYLTEQRIMMLI
jgi:hypothetical protein